MITTQQGFDIGEALADLTARAIQQRKSRAYIECMSALQCAFWEWFIFEDK